MTSSEESERRHRHSVRSGAAPIVSICPQFVKCGNATMQFSDVPGLYPAVLGESQLENVGG